MSRKEDLNEWLVLQSELALSDGVYETVAKFGEVIALLAEPPWLDAVPTEAGPYWVRKSAGTNWSEPFAVFFHGNVWVCQDDMQSIDFLEWSAYQFQRIEVPR